MKVLLQLLIALILLPMVSSAVVAQDSLRYIRLYLKDKGTARRVLAPGDPYYQQAVSLLTPRALARRAKVLHPDSLVSTDDLPIFQLYLDVIEATGARVVQRSRWLNTVMLLADTNSFPTLRSLPFVDSVRIARARRSSAQPFEKLTPQIASTEASLLTPRWLIPCITELYGKADTQIRLTSIDAAHRMGIAGEGVLVGVLDAGFDWRNHNALKDLDVIAERDFVNGDDNTADDLGEDAEEHGTAVMSMIGALFDGQIIGGAPHASFVLAKTEDVGSERTIEEDNFVAGLEWIESLGADVTNTSLGYTTFDPPETGHAYSELNGHTAHGSRGLNHAVRLGMICVVAAGNDAQKGYHYIGVPAEADSSIAVAAVTRERAIAGFSSRGFGPSGSAGPLGRSLKPDIASMGVGNWGANHDAPTMLLTGQGTSYASPMATSAIALILSARSSLRPWEVRNLLYRTSDHAMNPDTAFGYGIVNVDRMLDELSRTAPVVGLPRVLLSTKGLTIAAGVRYLGGFPEGYVTDRDPTAYLDLYLSRVGSLRHELLSISQPLYGTARWLAPESIGGERIEDGDSVVVDIFFRGTGRSIRRDTIRAFTSSTGHMNVLGDGSVYRMVSTLCGDPLTEPKFSAGRAVPNPFSNFTQLEFETDVDGKVSIIIYNALGEEMARVMDEEELGAGFHTAFFQPAGFPSGSYYYLIKHGENITSGSMIYLP